MKTLEFILTMLFCIVPALWIENYMFSPAFWTVFGAWVAGNILGYISRVAEE